MIEYQHTFQGSRVTERILKENLRQVLERHPNVLNDLDRKSMIQAAKEKKYVGTEKKH
jgi:hypothetical protein